MKKEIKSFLKWFYFRGRGDEQIGKFKDNDMIQDYWADDLAEGIYRNILDIWKKKR